MTEPVLEAFRPGVTSLALVICVVLIYLLIRRVIFRYQAECWFCSQPVSVSFFKRNSFTCPHCEQYNGFTEDGDYNKPIPAMYNSFLNQTRPHTEVPGGEVPGRDHFLCATCQSNQSTKIQQLASFVPISEMTFEVEYRDFCEQQDELYQLCPPCLLRVNREIERQDRVLAPTLHYYQVRRWMDERNARNWWKRWLFSFFLCMVRLGTVAATVSICASDILVHFGTETRSHLKSMKHYDRQSFAITALTLLALSVLLSGRKRSGRIDGFFLVLLLLVAASPRVKHLQGIWKSALISGGQCLLAPLCLVTSVKWFTIPYIRSPNPKKTKSHVHGLTGRSNFSQDGLNNYEGSSADEGEEIGDVPGSSGAHPQQAGPSHVQPPIQNSIDSLTLGPPKNTPKKTNDVWTSHTCIGSDTPPPPEVDGFRPVVHPARFNYDASVPGSAVSSTVDGPTNPGMASRAGRSGLRDSQAQNRVRHKPAEDRSLYEGDATSISESSDEGFSSISQSSHRWSRSRHRRRERRKNRGRHWRELVGSFFKSLVLPIMFGISLGLNLSAALYLSYKGT